MYKLSHLLLKWLRTQTRASHSVIQYYPTSFQRGMVNIKQNNAPLFRAKNSLFEIFQEMKSLYYRGLYTFFIQYTTLNDSKKATD